MFYFKLWSLATTSSLPAADCTLLWLVAMLQVQDGIVLVGPDIALCIQVRESFDVVCLFDIVSLASMELPLASM